YRPRIARIPVETRVADHGHLFKKRLSAAVSIDHLAFNNAGLGLVAYISRFYHFDRVHRWLRLTDAPHPNHTGISPAGGSCTTLRLLICLWARTSCSAAS